MFKKIKRVKYIYIIKIRLNKVKIIDASFVYTEPSTKRIKVKLTV